MSYNMPDVRTNLDNLQKLFHLKDIDMLLRRHNYDEIPYSTLCSHFNSDRDLKLKSIMAICDVFHFNINEFCSNDKIVDTFNYPFYKELQKSQNGTRAKYKAKSMHYSGGKYMDHQDVNYTKYMGSFEDVYSKTGFYNVYYTPTSSDKYNNRIQTGELTICYDGRQKRYVTELKIISKKKVIKTYKGEFSISSHQDIAFFELLSERLGEKVFIQINNKAIDNSMHSLAIGSIVSTTSGTKRRPCMQRIILSKKSLNIANDKAVYDTVRQYLHMGHKDNENYIYIEEDKVNHVLNKYCDLVPKIDEYIEDFNKRYVRIEKQHFLSETTANKLETSTDVLDKIFNKIRSSKHFHLLSTISIEFEDELFNKLYNNDIDLIAKPFERPDGA